MCISNKETVSQRWTHNFSVDKLIIKLPNRQFGQEQFNLANKIIHMDSRLKEEFTDLFRKLLGISIPTGTLLMVKLQHFANV